MPYFYFFLSFLSFFFAFSFSYVYLTFFCNFLQFLFYPERSQALVTGLILFLFAHMCCNPARQFLLNVETKQRFCLGRASFPVIWHSSALSPAAVLTEPSTCGHTIPRSFQALEGLPRNETCSEVACLLSKLLGMEDNSLRPCPSSLRPYTQCPPRNIEWDCPNPEMGGTQTGRPPS